MVWSCGSKTTTSELSEDMKPSSFHLIIWQMTNNAYHASHFYVEGLYLYLSHDVSYSKIKNDLVFEDMYEEDGAQRWQLRGEIQNEISSHSKTFFSHYVSWDSGDTCCCELFSSKYYSILIFIRSQAWSLRSMGFLPFILCISKDSKKIEKAPVASIHFHSCVLYVKFCAKDTKAMRKLINEMKVECKELYHFYQWCCCCWMFTVFHFIPF